MTIEGPQRASAGGFSNGGKALINLRLECEFGCRQGPQKNPPKDADDVLMPQGYYPADSIISIRSAFVRWVGSLASANPGWGSDVYHATQQFLARVMAT